MQTGRVLAMVSIVSSRLAPCFNIVIPIFVVRVESILALTPLLRPSEKAIRTASSKVIISTLSPHSSSPHLFKLS